MEVRNNSSFIKERLLYHGTNNHFREIELSKSRRRADFGPGFYLTDLKTQAARWARRVAIFSGGSPTVLIYTFNEEAAKGLRRKIFNEPSNSWAIFLKDCRRKGTEHSFDIVEGPVADDRVAEVLQLYLQGKYRDEEFVKRVRSDDYSHQIVLCTKNSLNCVKYKSFERVR